MSSATADNASSDRDYAAELIDLIENPPDRTPIPGQLGLFADLEDGS